MIDPALQGIQNFVVQTIQAFVLPLLTALVVAFLTVGFVLWLSRIRAQSLLKESVRAEMKTNLFISSSLSQYAEEQLKSEATVQPMPRYHFSAFRGYKRAGLLARLPTQSAEDLENLYLSMESVNKAGSRQEDLAFGPWAAYPNAHQLRLENLTYISDTIHNVILPYCERLRRTKL